MIGYVHNLKYRARVALESPVALSFSQHILVHLIRTRAFHFHPSNHGDFQLSPTGRTTSLPLPSQSRSQNTAHPLFREPSRLVGDRVILFIFLSPPISYPPRLGHHQQFKQNLLRRPLDPRVHIHQQLDHGVPVAANA